MEWGSCVGLTPLCLGIVSLLCSVSVLIISHIYIYIKEKEDSYLIEERNAHINEAFCLILRLLRQNHNVKLTSYKLVDTNMCNVMGYFFDPSKFDVTFKITIKLKFNGAPS
jgi:hypothetical protein